MARTKVGELPASILSASMGNPFVRTSGGDFYVVTVLSGVGNQSTLRMYKSSDEGANWARQDSSNEPPTGLTTTESWFAGGAMIATALSTGNTIHVITQGVPDSSNYRPFRYAEYSTTGDTWTTGSFATGPSVTSGFRDQYTACDIEVRSSGDVVVMYTDVEKVHGTSYVRPVIMEDTGSGFSARGTYAGLGATTHDYRLGLSMWPSNGKVELYSYQLGKVIQHSLDDGSTALSTATTGALASGQGSAPGVASLQISTTNTTTKAGCGRFVVTKVNDTGGLSISSAQIDLEIETGSGGVIFALPDHPTSPRWLRVWSKNANNEIMYHECLSSTNTWTADTVFFGGRGTASTKISAITWTTVTNDFKLGVICETSSDSTTYGFYTDTLVSGGTTLTVNDISQSSSIDTFALTQVHNLTVNDLSASNTLDTFILTQQHQLAGVLDLSQSSTIDTFAITQASNLVVQDLSVTVQVDAVVLAQLHILTVSDLASSNTVDVFNITQSHILTGVGDLSVTQTIDNVVLQLGVVSLTVADVSVTATVDTVALTQLHILTVADLSVTQTIDTFALAQVHNLTVNDLSVTQTIDTFALDQGFTLVVSDVSQTSTIDTFVLTQLHVLIVSDISSGQRLTSDMRFTEIPTLLVQDLSVTVTMDNVVLSLLSELVVADVSVGITIDSVALTQVHNILVNDLSVTHAVDTFNLTQIYNMTVADIATASTVDTFALTQTHNMTVADIAVAHTIDAFALAQTYSLVVDDLIGVVTIASPLIEVSYNLTVADITVGVTMDGDVFADFPGHVLMHVEANQFVKIRDSDILHVTILHDEKVLASYTTPELLSPFDSGFDTGFGE